MTKEFKEHGIGRQCGRFEVILLSAEIVKLGE